MNHEDFRQRLDAYVDGQLPEPKRLEMHRHAHECRPCADELAALLALVDAARHLPRAVQPGRDLWPELEAKLGAGSPAVAVAAGASTPRRSRVAPPRAARALDALAARWRRPWTLATAAAAVAAVAAVLWFAWELQRREPAPRSDRRAAAVAEARAPAGLAAALTGLEQECMGAGKLLQASLLARDGPVAEDVAASVAAGLSDVERSITETRAALAADPGNAALLRMLAVRYQQKLALLHGALQRVEAA